MYNKNYFIISGAVGSGKTSVMNSLKSKGYSVQTEIFDRLSLTDAEVSRDHKDWKKPIDFIRTILEESIGDYLKNFDKPYQPIFFDGGIPDIDFYADINSLPRIDLLHQAIIEYKYNNTIFLFPPWKELFVKNKHRDILFEECVDRYSQLRTYYSHLGYNVVEVEEDTIDNRASFIMVYVQNRE